MNITIFAKKYFNKATLEKQATESFCAKHQILSSKDYFAMLSCFEKMIRRAFSGWNKTISLPMCQQLERQNSFVIPIEKSTFLTALIAESICRSGFAHRI